MEVSSLHMSNKTLEEKLNKLIEAFKQLNENMEKFEEKVNELILEISSLAENFSKILMIEAAESLEPNTCEVPEEMYT